MQPVRWGVLSTARINDLFLDGVARSSLARVVAVGARDRERAARFADERGIERVHAGYEALLADEDVEAVYIPLPNSMHVEWAVRALEAGKHVLCEKPLSRHPEEVQRAFDVADRRGLLLMEAFMFRHNPKTHRLAELVAGGAVGSMRLIRSQFSFNARDPSNIRLSRALDGGALMDVGCYCVSGTRLLAGEPERVYAEQVLGGDGVDVVFAATMRFAGDLLAEFDAGLALASRDELEVIGEDGSLFLDDPWHARSPVIELRRGDGVELIEIAAEDSYRLEADNFSLAIRGEAEPLLGRADALGQARAIEALYRSADTGRPVPLVAVP